MSLSWNMSLSVSIFSPTIQLPLIYLKYYARKHSPRRHGNALCTASKLSLFYKRKGWYMCRVTWCVSYKRGKCNNQSTENSAYFFVKAVISPALAIIVKKMHLTFNLNSRSIASYWWLTRIQLACRSQGWVGTIAAAYHSIDHIWLALRLTTWSPGALASALILYIVGLHAKRLM